MSLFCFKRLLIAFITAKLQEPISISILTYTKLSIFTIGYTINQKPYKSKILNVIDVINESFLLVTGYYMIIFSKWTYNPEIGESEDVY